MRDNMYEGMWSPFDPNWYQQAFDKFISTADELFNQDEIINAGYVLPDSDGSKSSVFHQDAVTNNSFDEGILRDTLCDIYMNSYHRLTAANHDSVHFFQWHGTMKDVTLVPNTQMCEIRIPTDGFINSSSRDKYKFRQYYRKWVSVTDLMNDWDTFQFACLLFINQKIYSEYEFRMDDQETVIRFKYYEHWRSNKYTNIETGDVVEYTDEEFNALTAEEQAVLRTHAYPIYIYKFDTNAQCRVKVSKELIVNQWKWKMPMSFISQERKLGKIDVAKRKNYNCPTCDTEYILTNGASIFTDHVMVAFNKISDQSIRTDGNKIADILGDNLEFLKIEDGYIDLTKCSEYNKHLLITEEDQWIWMTLLVPKFMHEFPILQPTDVIYRPHVPMYEHVKIKNNGVWYDNQVSIPDPDNPNFDIRKDVYVDINDTITNNFNVYINDDGELILEYDGSVDLTRDTLFIDEEGYLTLISEFNPIEVALSRYHFFLSSLGELYMDYVWDDGWKYIIRPLVLSDAFDEQDADIYDKVLGDMSELKRLIIAASQEVNTFRTFIDYVYNHRQGSSWITPESNVNFLIVDGELLLEYNNSVDDPNIWVDGDYNLNMVWEDNDVCNTLAQIRFNEVDGFMIQSFIDGEIPRADDSYYIDDVVVVSYEEDFVTNFNRLRDSLEAIHDEYKSYLETRFMQPDESYLSLWDEYNEVCEDILNSSDYFWAIDRFHRQHGKYRDFWSFISPLIYIPDEFTSIYEVANIIKQIDDPVLWEDVDKFKSQLRFRRPIDSTDIWTFEYDRDDKCWRPVILNIDHKFPDVYLFSDADVTTPTPNRIFKSFIFYTDTPNPRDISSEIVRPTASWDKDLQEYEFNKAGTYRDIFMEKFYWTGVRTIYRGLLATKYRWECIEYIQDNSNYDRFNMLFLNTMDPYVKMGEATYLKSENYQFITDDRISKMNEYMKAAFLGYTRITGFEMYLNKSWSPSYFDTVIDVDDTFDGTPRLIRRPRSTFDTRRVLRILKDSQTAILAAITTLKKEVTDLRHDIEEYELVFDMTLLDELDLIVDRLGSNIDDCIEFINGLDMDIYSIEDINTIIDYIEKHFSLITEIRETFNKIKEYIGDTDRFTIKLDLLYPVSEIIRIALHDIIFTLGSYIQSFDMDSFMKGVNNYEYYNEYDHKGDDCLIGAINNFHTPWPLSVQTARNRLYVSTAALWAFFDTNKSYTQSEVEKMLQMINGVRDDIESLHTEVFKCWKDETEWDSNIVDKFEFARDSINSLSVSMEKIVELRSQLFNTFDEIRSRIVEVTEHGIDTKEESYVLDIDKGFDEILYHLSYIAGENRKAEALAVYSRTVGDIEGWIAYLTRTRDVYQRMYDVVKEPNAFLNTLKPYHELLEALLAYLKTVDREFIPDTNRPTYSTVYQVSDINMINGGFNHAVGDMAYFQNLGIYKISGVGGNINTATDLWDPNRDEIDLSYDAWLDEFGRLIIEIPNDPESTAYLDSNGNVIVRLPDDSDSSIQDYKFSIVTGNLYLSQYDTDDFILTDSCELIITVDTDIEFDLYVNDDGYLILEMDEEDSIDLELYRFYVTTQSDLMLRRADNVHYRNTLFRDPMWQSNPYDSITSGKGLGIVIESTASTSMPIFNDDIVTPYRHRVDNLLKMVIHDMDSINPYQNISAERSLSMASRIQDDWKGLLNFYSGNITPEIIDACTVMMDSLDMLIEPLSALISYREQNNLKGLISEFSDFMDYSDKIFKESSLWGPNYIYFSNRVRSKLQMLSAYYGNGMTWNDADELQSILDECVYELKLFYRQMIRKLGNVDVENEYNLLLVSIDDIVTITSTISNMYPAVRHVVAEIQYKNELIPDPIRVDKWYSISKSSIAVEGRNYQPGDIIEIVPALPTDIYGNEIHDNEANIMADKIFFKVTQVNDDGGILKAEPIMDYALPYPILGIRDTLAKTSSGEFAKVMISTREITGKDCTLFWTDDSYIPKVHQYDENDLFTFRFNNIHDLPIKYDVFFSGKQKQHVIIRHEHEIERLKPRDVDIIYLNANDVMELADSSVFIEGEQYFIYRLKDLSIIDPGTGYYNGQIIRVDADQLTLQLQVSDITDDNLKGITEVEMLQNYQLFYGVNPATDHAEVVTDSMNNIDDEYNSGYYDNLPVDGIIKPAAPPYTVDEYPFISKRFDTEKGEFRFEIVPATGELLLEADTDVDFKLRITSDGELILTLADDDYIELEEYRFFISTDDNLILIRTAEVEPGRNTTWMYPDIDFPEGYDDMKNGDPDDHTYLGTREENSILDIVSDRWNGFAEVVPVTHPFTPDADRVPPNQPTRGEYQYIQSLRIHSIADVPKSDLTVKTYADLPTHVEEWSKVAVGKKVIVKKDETQGNHQMMYRVQTFLVSGYIIYDDPIAADKSWKTFSIKWNEINCFQDLPTMVEQYPSDRWYTDSYNEVKYDAVEGNIDRVLTPVASLGTYIHQVTVDDISVYNFTLKRWEDVTNGLRWKFTRTSDGFTLTFLEDGEYSYNMRLYLNKTSVQQMRNEQLKRNAVFNIDTEIFDEVNTKSRNISVIPGRQLRFRKSFPYEQKEEYALDGTKNQHELVFKLAPYMHYKNEIHVHDITLALIYPNGDDYELIRYEDILNSVDEEGNPMYEIQIKDDKANSRGYETQTTCTVVGYGDLGTEFVNGEAWAWNEEHRIHIFGHIESDMMNDGKLIKFIPDHFVNAPNTDELLEFKVYQFSTYSQPSIATIIVHFKTERVEVAGDGWLHNVTNPYAPIKDEFKIVVHYDYGDSIWYRISINKNPEAYQFIRAQSELFPVFNIPDSHIPQNRLYITTELGRLPLINPSTGKPSMRVTYTDTDTEVEYLNIYHKYELMEIHSTPYPMRSVYTQRRVPVEGYIDLSGKINKPLNKKYFEFWMNGRLLSNEVTIISPTKIFLHGLKSLRNFEIVEINRDPNEYFSDVFLTTVTESGVTHPSWDYNTYLDDALEATNMNDTYTIQEQKALLNPVWPQLQYDDDQYAIYPNNVDEEQDILMRVDTNMDISDMSTAPLYPFTVYDVPSIEGVPIVSRSLSWEQLGFKPITEQMIIDMLNEEWADEIASGLLPQHTIVSDEDWYGMVTRLYDEDGNSVTDVDTSAYNVTSDQVLGVNTKYRIARLVSNPVEYDLT